MTSTPESSSASPWVTIWFSPRRTIDGILASPSRHSVWSIWLLAALGAISGFSGQLVSSGFTGLLLDWRLLLGVVFASVAVGIGWLYLAALVYRGIASLLGGRASPHQLRAAFAWSGVPAIVGLAVVLALLVAWKAFGGAAAADAPSPLLTGVAAIGSVWSLVVLVGMLSRVEQFGLWRSILAYVPVLIVPFLVTFLIRAFLFQPFNSPSQSMAPTLLVGDHYFVSKYAYGYGPYSLPWPLFSERVFGSQPARGDVVVFCNLRAGGADYVKRVVGLPGERIQMKQGLLHINGVPVARERLTDFTGSDSCGTVAGAAVKRWRETLPGGVSHETLDCIDNGFYDDTNVYTVPDGHVFMLGDNRDNSTDSRVLNSIGYVPLENIIGRVGMIYFSRATGSDTAAVDRPERVGMMVR